MTTPRRLPAIRVDVTPPSVVEALPRMDIAVFVGFAEKGPTHRPVVIESVWEYVMVFGSDTQLTFDHERHEPVLAYLSTAVRAFFANGGRRCWIIRVARTRELEDYWSKARNRKDSSSGIASANHFVMSGVLALSKSEPYLSPAKAQASSVGSWSNNLRVQTALTATRFQLQLDKDKYEATTKHISFSTKASLQVGDLIELDELVTANNDKVQCYAIVDEVNKNTTKVDATLCAAFKSKTVELNSLAINGHIEIISATSHKEVAAILSDTEISFTIDSEDSRNLALGQWFCFRQLDNKQNYWLQSEQLNSAVSSKSQNLVDVIIAGKTWCEIPIASLDFPLTVPAYATVLTLDLRVLSNQQEKTYALTGVGLTPKHKSAWWRQVTDDVYYKKLDEQIKIKESFPFPLAAMDEEIEKTDKKPLAWIPLGVSSLFGEALAPLDQPTTALERDGLSRFDAELFLDPELATLSVDYLIQQADTIRYLASSTRELFGIHAALSIGTAGVFNEASLIAVPDAVHIGWKKNLSNDYCTVTMVLSESDSSLFCNCTSKLESPVWRNKSSEIRFGEVFRLDWQSPVTNASFILEKSSQDDFKDVHELYRGDNAWFDLPIDEEGIFYYRVKTISEDECNTASLLIKINIEKSTQKTSSDTVNNSANNNCEQELLRIHRALLRLAAASGELFAVMGLPRHYRAADAKHYVSKLRTVGSNDIDALNSNEHRALSYGAVYHPWIVSSTLAEPVSSMASTKAQQIYPPDGIATGILASRADRRGAWIAPANELFKSVCALTPFIDPSDYQTLQDVQINIIRADARGFLTLSADTLANDAEWCPINVRRLFILLRRLALRRGVRYVFEPNDDVLRRAVERGFTFLLTDLFRRGAFAGATAQESFNVVTRQAVHTNADFEAGRFFVDLQVAPSLPLQFLTIRLAQSGEHLAVLEEV